MSTIEKKIIVGFGTICLLFLAATTAVFFQARGVSKSSRLIQDVLEPSIQANLLLSNGIDVSLSSLYGWVSFKEEVYHRQMMAAWSNIRKKYRQLLGHSDRWVDTDQIDRLAEAGRELRLLEAYQKEVEEISRAGDWAQALRLLKEKVVPKAHDLQADLKRISDPQKWKMERVFLKAERQQSTLIAVSIVFLLISIGSSVVLGAVLSRAVILPLHRKVNLATAVARGDYSAREGEFDENDELDVALRAMTEQLRAKDLENMEKREALQSTNEQLSVVNKQLMNSHEELTQFSYRTSHDLKAPMITVRGIAELMMEDLEDGNIVEVKKNAAKIEAHMIDLENLINEILALAKADLEETVSEKVCIETIVDGIRGRLQSIYIENDVKIETDIDSSLEIVAPVVRVKQVLENLISNSIKYSDKEKARRFVKVTTKAESDQNTIVVSDNGIGIPKEFESRVFEMFQRFHPKVAPGTGLGMHLVKKHVDKMGARISFTTSPNGTEFELRFPRTS